MIKRKTHKQLAGVETWLAEFDVVTPDDTGLESCQTRFCMRLYEFNNSQGQECFYTWEDLIPEVVTIDNINTVLEGVYTMFGKPDCVFLDDSRVRDFGLGING